VFYATRVENDLRFFGQQRKSDLQTKMNSSKLEESGLGVPTPKKKISVKKFTHLLEFAHHLFYDKDTARKGKMIVEGILRARSPHLSYIAGRC